MSRLNLTRDDLQDVARRGVGVAAVLIDAGLHPRRTAQAGMRLARGLLPTEPEQRAEETVAPAEEGAPPAEKTVMPVEETVVADEDAEVVPQGPAPHLPAGLAAEIERDYGDELPGIHDQA
jgi:hypothetical protein